MKLVFNKLGLLFLFMIGSLFITESCNKQPSSQKPLKELNHSPKTTPDQHPLVAKISPANEVIWIMPESKLKKIMVNWFKDNTVIHHISLETELNESGEKTYYILGEGFDGNNARQIAIYLEAEQLNNLDSEIILLSMSGLADSCAGAPCNRCKLTGPSGNKGCDCKGTGEPSNPSGFCNHSTGDIALSVLVN